MNGPIVIIGAGQAGQQIAESLRQDGYSGEIILLGDEAHAPYHRPPLSKAWLAGETDSDRLAMRGAGFYHEKGVTLRLNAEVVRIDRARQIVILKDGEEIPYAGLALATGARPVSLPVPGVDLAGVHVLRSMSDALGIARDLKEAKNVLVVGGGFIGLEVAAAARKKGASVTVVEAQDRLMARIVSPILSHFYTRLHDERGVTIAFSTQVAEFKGENGRVIGACDKNGTFFPADMVVMGVGARPNDQLAVEAGLACERGVIVDEHSRTSDPLIVAAGDCAVRRRPDGSLMRLESVQNAMEQGKAAAAALLGADKPFTASPWFWSDQFDIKLQMAGSSLGYDQSVLRGLMADRAFSIFYFREGALVGVDSVNRPGDHMVARRLLDAGRSLTPEQASSRDFDLKTLLR